MIFPLLKQFIYKLIVMLLYHTLSMLRKGKDYYDVQILLLIRFVKN